MKKIQIADVDHTKLKVLAAQMGVSMPMMLNIIITKYQEGLKDD